MDQVIEFIENEEPEEMSWESYAIKQAYLIQFHRGLLKAPKMLYYILTENGLISFEGRPHYDTKPLCFLPYEQLSSIKVDDMELNSCKLCCMQLTSKTTPSLTLAFKRKEDRDEWMMIMMKAFSEVLLSAPAYSRTPSTSDENKSSESDDFTKELEHNFSKTSSTVIDENKATASDELPTKEKLDRKLSSMAKEWLERTLSTGSHGHSLRRKRRKGDRGSIRRSKSYDVLASDDEPNTPSNVSYKKLPVNAPSLLAVNALNLEAGKASLPETRKRKSQPDVFDVTQFPSIKETKKKLFASSCSFEHRDSLTVEAEKQLKNKSDAKHKNVFTKLRSKLEHPRLC